MFLFRIGSYDDPALDAEAEELLRQRLEAGSRAALPGVWRMNDALISYAAKGPGRESRRGRYIVYGVVLIALGVFILVPGLARPGGSHLVLAGVIALAAGVLELLMARKRKPARIPASCKKDAAKLLGRLRASNTAGTEVALDEGGIRIGAGEDAASVPYESVTGIFETERLWLLTYGGQRALLLKKSDLVSGQAEDLTPYILKMTGHGG